MEPFFTFVARIPPRDLHEMCLEQIARHLDWWQSSQPDPRQRLMAQHPALQGGDGHVR